MAGRRWGGFGCRLTQTLITAAAEPALHSRLPSRGCGHWLQAHAGAARGDAARSARAAGMELGAQIW